MSAAHRFDTMTNDEVIRAARRVRSFTRKLAEEASEEARHDIVRAAFVGVLRLGREFGFENLGAIVEDAIHYEVADLVRENALLREQSKALREELAAQREGEA